MEGDKILLQGAEAAEAMKCHPQRRVPVMLSSPHDAAPPFHEDWTIIDGSSHDPVKWELEIRLRDVRNPLIQRAAGGVLQLLWRKQQQTQEQQQAAAAALLPSCSTREIRWNAELIEAEGLPQRRGGSTAASAEHS